MHKCPICNSDIEVLSSTMTELKIGTEQDRFGRCTLCGTISVNPKYYLSTNEEVLRYGKHDNSLKNSNYCDYLLSVYNSFNTRQIIEPILDFGCGENAVLTELLRQNGIDIDGFDPNYENFILKDRMYNTILSIEAVEHFREPMVSFTIMNNLLNSGGDIFIRTELLESVPYFSAWWYKNDPTHIVFYSRTSFEFISDYFSWEIVSFDNKNRIHLRKK